MQERFIGCVGLGHWGKNIFRNLYELGVLHTACDSNEATVLEMKQKCPQVQFTTTYSDMLENQEIKAIAIAAPAVNHYTMAKEALSAGKDVFVEKPLALRVQEGEELVVLARKNSRILMVGHVLQYHPAVTKLAEIITEGKLGKIQYVYSNRLNIGKLRIEENILWSFAPHDISAIISLVKDEPVKISAFGGDYLSRGVYDTTITTLEFKNDVRAHIFVSWIHPFKEQKLVVVGSTAMAVFDDLSEEKLLIYRHAIEWKDGKIPVARKADYEVIRVGKEEPLKNELKHFVECVNTRKSPKTDGSEGLRVLRIIAHCEKALSAPGGA